MLPQPQFQTDSVCENYQTENHITVVEKNREESEPQFGKKKAFALTEH